jgi:hypothetical protein
MNAVIKTEQTEHLPTNPAELIFNDHAFARLERVAALMASGKATVPAHLRGSTGDCFAILLQAARWGMDPYACAQKTHLINGVLGYEAQLVAAVVNQSSLITGRFAFEWFGPWEKVIGKFEVRKGDKGEYRVPGWKLTDEDGIGINVSATLRGETEPRVLTLLLAQARTRNSTLWAEDPKQQLAYLAQKRWARLYAPDVIMGVYTADELETSPERDITPAAAPAAIMEKLGFGPAGPTLASITERINAAKTDADMKKIARDAKALEPDDRDKARELWAMKQGVLAAQAAEVVDADTGEISATAADRQEPQA